jgi:hypothetical protein
MTFWKSKGIRTENWSLVAKGWGQRKGMSTRGMGELGWGMVVFHDYIHF